MSHMPQTLTSERASTLPSAPSEAARMSLEPQIGLSLLLLLLIATSAEPPDTCDFHPGLCDSGKCEQ